MSNAEARVLARFPNARCFRNGRPAFQIWDMHFTFAGTKLGEGSTEKTAWQNAAKKLEKIHVLSEVTL